VDVADLTPDERQQAAAMLRRQLEAVQRGELDAPGSHGARLLRRLEGVVIALEDLGRGLV